MRILLLSALYPPDIAPPALYTKELARRLSGTDQVTVLTYGKLPEQIPSVRIATINKRKKMPTRLLAYTLLLLKEVKHADVIYAQNGPSVELPLLFASYITKTPIVLCISDKGAHAHAAVSKLRSFLEQSICRKAKEVIKEIPSARPIILPLEPRPVEALASWEHEWSHHTNRLKSVFENI